LHDRGRGSHPSLARRAKKSPPECFATPFPGPNQTFTSASLTLGHKDKKEKKRTE
jgi:hypothetical protein